MWLIQVEEIKSFVKDNLPALSSTARTIISLITVVTLVVACLQWKDANRLAKEANRLSLTAICEGYPVSYSKDAPVATPRAKPQFKWLVMCRINLQAPSESIEP
jgi:hypothetical protein